MEYDLLIVGGGPAGYPCALEAHRLGLKVAIIEKESYLGGTCLHVGCIPSKTLLHATHLLQELHHASYIDGSCNMNLSALMKKKDEVIHTLASGLQTLFSSKKIARFTGAAQLVGPNNVVVHSSDSETTLTARFIVLATGSQPIELSSLPFDEKVVVSSTGALEIDEVPQSLVVVGAGVIGVELASVYKRLGSQVTVVELLPQVCSGFDETVSLGLKQALEGQGIRFLLNCQVTGSEKAKGGVTIITQTTTKETVKPSEQLFANRVLVAVGRKPNTEGLHLKEVGVATLPSGHIQIDNGYRTSVSSIFAIGDLVKGPMLAHRASEEGIALAEYFAGKRPEVDMVSIPNVIYTSPEVASCGFTEGELQGRRPIKVGRIPMKIVGRAVASGTTEGFVKVIGDRDTDRLLGVHILAEHASEMIAVASLALQMKLKVSDLAHLPFAHPTLSEAIKEAAASAH